MRIEGTLPSYKQLRRLKHLIEAIACMFCAMRECLKDQGAADVMHQLMHPNKNATPATPTTPMAPITPRISPYDRRSPTPSFGSRDNDQTNWHEQTETNKKYMGGKWWYGQNYWPYAYVGKNRVHAHSWWQLKRSSSYGKYYCLNDFGESLWAANN